MHARLFPWPLSVSLLLPLCLMLTPRAQAGPPNNNYRLIFADEFNGDTLDSMKWVSKYPWGRTHNHKAYMSKDALSFNGEALVITATDTATGNKDFTSGAVSTGYNKFRFKEGYVEARIDQPSQPGSWTAFWMLDSGWPPEVDIMEFPIRGSGDTFNYKTNYHWGKGNNPQSIGTPDHWGGGNLASNFHNYGLRWTSNKLEFYLDGKKVREFQNGGAVDDLTGAYLILNYAVGNNNNWGGELPNTVNPGTWSNSGNKMKIDWVRVWEKQVAMDARFVDPQGNGSAEWEWEAGWSGGAAPTQAGQTARLGTQGSAAQALEWDKLGAAGRVYFDGDTDFTLGNGDESLLLAMNDGSGWSRLWVSDGGGSHVVNARLEMWSNLSIANQRGGSLTLNGDLMSLGRETSGGKLVLRGNGDGGIVFNGAAYQQRTTSLEDQAHVIANGGFYQSDTLFADAAVHVMGGSTLVVDGLNVAGGASEGTSDTSLGYLGVGSEKLVLDDGTVVLRGSTASYRGFTIGGGGATLVAESGSDVWLRQSSLTEKAIVSTAGGDLTLGGAGDGFLDKVLGGSGGLIKTGHGAWTIARTQTYTGATAVDEGTLVVNGSLGVGGVTVGVAGAIGGAGQIAGDLVSFGAIAPGNSPGILDVAGTLALDADSLLIIELAGHGGIAGVDHDQLRVQGVAELGGATLRIEFADGFTPQHGDVFEILTAGGITGAFDSVLTGPITAGLSYQVRYNGDSVSLGMVAQSTPEPNSAVLLLAGLGLLTARSRRPG